MKYMEVMDRRNDGLGIFGKMKNVPGTIDCSISVNDQWRICFRFEDGDAFEVEITDYH